MVEDIEKYFCTLFLSRFVDSINWIDEQCMIHPCCCLPLFFITILKQKLYTRNVCLDEWTKSLFRYH